METARQFLSRKVLRIEPRKMWPAGFEGPKGRIAAARQAEAGVALTVYGEGLGDAVAVGKFHQGHFDDRLVRAASDAFRREPLNGAPRWVTAVPSLRRPRLVRDFASRLAEALGLPFRPVIRKRHETAEQKTMENAFQQARNIVDAFEVDESQVMAEPVLLVDDLVDSRWTFTVCAMLLREAGSGPVYPLALASASRQDGD